MGHRIVRILVGGAMGLAAGFLAGAASLVASSMVLMYYFQGRPDGMARLNHVTAVLNHAFWFVCGLGAVAGILHGLKSSREGQGRF